MSKYRKVRDTCDSNHGEIVAFLKSHGIEVIETERPVDILIHNNGKSGWAEIKTEARNANIKRGQLEFMSETKMPVAIVKTEGEALIFAEYFEGWSQRQKDQVAVFLEKNPGVKQWHPAAIERLLNT